MRALFNRWRVAACAGLVAGAGASAPAAESLTLSTNAVPPPAAAAEILRQTSREAGLRLGPFDLFPHAAAGATYDDNVLVSSQNAINDVVWSVSPGLTAALGDVSTAIAGPVTIDRLRNLLYYSLADESTKPRRFLGVDYTPTVNFYTKHDQLNNVDHAAQLSGGYNFSRLTSELDFDYRHGQYKDAGVGDLITLETWSASLRNRYDLSERSSVEVNGDYARYDYIRPSFQGFQDFKNTDWFNHQLGEKFSGSAGVVFGDLEPSASPSQTYEQVLLRGTYRLSGKIYLNAYGGVEWRQLGTQAADTLNPVFGVSGIYAPRETTTLTLEAHRREEASPFNDYNYTLLGFSAGVRQLLFNRVYAGVRGGYDNYQYTQTAGGNATVRTDDVYSFQVTGEYEFNRHLTGSVFYTRQEDKSGVQVYSFKDNLVGAKLLWRY